MELVPHTEAKNAYYARFRVQKFYQGQDFYLQIDSHMQFIKDWDAILIEELTNCNSLKPILSVYPPDFESKPVTLAMCSNGFNALGVPLFKARSVKPFRRPIVSNFWAAGFSFSEGSLITECGYLERIGDVFFGEEIFQMKQFWSHGY